MKGTGTSDSIASQGLGLAQELASCQAIQAAVEVGCSPSTWDQANAHKKPGRPIQDILILHIHIKIFNLKSNCNTGCVGAESYNCTFLSQQKMACYW